MGMKSRQYTTYTKLEGRLLIFLFFDRMDLFDKTSNVSMNI